MQLDFIKHSLSTHSLEHTFHFKCGIRGCPHSFKFGATFSSFKTHANRSHPNWQQHVTEVNDFEPTPSTDTLNNLLPPDEDANVDDTPTLPPDEDADVDHTPPLTGECVCDSTEFEPVVSSQHRAAMFLLTFREKYKLSQKAIDFAVSSINSIVGSVCDTIKVAVHESLQSQGLNADNVMRSFEFIDPFESLRTEYQQLKFYREEFGLVVCCIMYQL